jgi:ubiquinone/menaquinone biosynthesis C-methylase UbiE
MWFDGQAEQFDDSAGLERGVGRSIAQAIRELSGCTGDDILLDVGAGTGAIGVHFAGLSSRYVGLDRSRPMLEIFQRKLTAWPKHMLLLQADSDRRWPIRDHALAVIFASRVAHHLQTQHFVQEVFRVARSGGHLLLGHVRREADSLPSRLQRYKRTVLAEYGVRTRAGHRAIQEITDTCCLRCASPLPPTTVTQWSRTTTARRLLASWEKKPQLNSGVEGNALDAAQRAAAVNVLTSWAQDEFGDLDRPHEFSETYALEAVRLP